MAIGIGIDLCDVRRVERRLAADDGSFVDGVFAPAETAYCRSMHVPAMHFAARFAAKEATVKALAAAGVAAGVGPDLEVTRSADGRPGIALHGPLGGQAADAGVEEIALSLSHTRELAVACAVVTYAARTAGKERA